MSEAEDAAKNGDNPSPEGETPDVQAQMTALREQMGQLAELMKMGFAKKEEGEDPEEDTPPPPPPEEDKAKKEEEESELAKMKSEFATLTKQIEDLKANGVTPEPARGNPGGGLKSDGSFDVANFDWPSYILGEIGQEQGLLVRKSDGSFKAAGAWEDVQ